MTRDELIQAIADGRVSLDDVRMNAQIANTGTYQGGGADVIRNDAAITAQGPAAIGARLDAI